MPRYDDRYSSNDRYGGARLYVGHLSSRTRERDLEHLFSKYGRIRDLDMKRDYAFIEFSDPRDADDARYRLDGRDFDGSRITVEFARGIPRGSREFSSSRGPPPGSGRCFNCGLEGHWARDCSAGDWKNKCYRCGDRGHIERNCKNSPKKLRRDPSYSRSPVRSRSRSPRLVSALDLKMPRYDDRYSSNDRYGGARLYVGHLSSRTRERDLEHLFSKYGRIRDLEMKRDYAFIEFSDPRDADDARHMLDGRDFDGSRITVEFARGTPRGSRDFSSSRGPPPGSGRCFNCGLEGHWARDCSAGDWKNKCYRCGDRGHIERNCKNSPKKLRRDASYSRSPVRSRSRSPRRRRGSPSRSYSRDRTYSRSRSPVRKEKDHSPETARSRSPETARSRSPEAARSRSPETARNGSPEVARSRSPELMVGNSQSENRKINAERLTTVEELPWDIMNEILDRVPRHKAEVGVTVCKEWHDYFRLHHQSLTLESPGVSLFPLGRRKFCNILSLTLDFSLSDPPVPGQTTSTYNGEVVQLVTDEDLATVGVDCPKLERLRLFCCDLVTATGLTQLARGCRALEYIHLAHCRHFDDAGVLAVVGACNRLKHLEIAFLEVTAAGIEALSKITMVTAYDCPRSLHEI